MENNDYAPSPAIIERATPSNARIINEIARLAWQATYPNAELGITEDDIRRRTEGENGSLLEEKIEQWRQTIESAGENHEVFIARAEDEVVG